MPLFGRHRARDDMANVTPRRQGWALFSPYPQRNTPGTYANNTNTTTRRTFGGRTNDATMYPRRSRRIGRADARANGAQRVPLVTKVKRTLGIQSRGQQFAPGRPVDTVGRPRGGGLFRKTPRIRERTVEPQRNRGWFSGSGGRYRT